MNVPLPFGEQACMDLYHFSSAVLLARSVPQKNCKNKLRKEPKIALCMPDFAVEAVYV